MVAYLLDCATRSISLRLATPALLMSLFAASISSSAMVSWMLVGCLLLMLLAPVSYVAYGKVDSALWCNVD